MERSMDKVMIKNEERGSMDRERGRDRERSRRGDRPSRFSSNTRDRSPVRDRRKAGGDRRVYVSNVAYESKWQDLKDLFRAEVGEVTYVELYTDDNDKPRGCGVVEFETSELAARAVEKMHRFDLKGRKLVVKEDSDANRDKFGRPNPSRGTQRGNERETRETGGGTSIRREETPRGTWDGGNNSNATPMQTTGTSNAKWGNTYGLSPSFLESLWITSPLVSKVFVANLDYKVDEKKLREVFRLAGRVIHTELSVDKEGKSRGFGVVEYEHPVEAVQAISLLHNQMLFDRRLTVRMDRVDKVDGPPKLPEGLKSIGMGLGVNGTVLNDVTRNLPSSGTVANLPSNVQQLQVAAAAAQVQLQGAQLGHQTSLNSMSQGPLAHLAGSNTLAPNLTNVSGLLGQSINVSELANLNANQQFGGATINAGQLNPGLNPGLAGLNAGIASGLSVGGGLSAGFSTINNQNSIIGGGSTSFNHAGSAAGFNHPRDFDSMSAALSGGNTTNCFSMADRGQSRDNFNGPSSRVGNGSRSFGGNMPTRSTRRTEKVVVKNLPPNTSWEHLEEKFRNAGEFLVVNMTPERDAALITFRSELEAERAVREYDRTRFDGRTIDVLLWND